MDLHVPDHLITTHLQADDTARSWLSTLPTLVDDLLTRWTLTPDGPPRSGQAALALPVRRADDTPAVLRLQPPTPGTRAAVTGLRRWAGRGAVRLLEHDPTTTTTLLERLDATRTLETVEDDDEATRVIADLLTTLTQVQAPPDVPRLRDVAGAMVDRAPDAARSLRSPTDRALLLSWSATVAELLTDPGDRLLHWDLHYGNVLAGDRAPWLAIDPEPLAGDPGFDLWPALDSNWNAVLATGTPTRAVRRRFDLLTEALGLDRERAAAWTLGRLLQNSLWDVEDGRTSLAPSQVTVAHAVTPAGSNP
ncbi:MULTISPECIES: aminoglycoside phosphotransferase family protein [Actinosynnema]|uniref:aminoglycoside phosphotransferase family protein n=1 Tax=Actinosynnema TaxID=40566 RepID=UPI0020A396B1|nr:aminoglycoside phosphotransferase family protein [Actinosynnema pretiosum]MCP2094751.1 streptomycin 6-kinase [Actinosynnema pretiosum]